MLYLGFFGDGPKWDNFARLGAYPSGFSYLRPFRYQDKRIAPNVLADLDRRDPTRFAEREAVICARFSTSDDRRLIVPIRKAIIRHVDRQPGDNAIYFTVGPYIDFTRAASLRDVSFTLSEELHEDVILFESDIEPAAGDFIAEDQEFSAWSHYCDLLGREEQFPIREEAKRSVFIRFRSLKSNKPVSASKLHVSSQEGARYGAELKEGESYELVYHHRIPALMNTRMGFDPFLLTPTAATTNVELNRVSEEITGNYEPHTLEIYGVVPSGTYEELNFKPSIDEVATDGEQTLHTVAVPLPLRVKRFWKHRLKTKWLPAALLLLFLLVSTLSQTIYDAVVKGQELDFGRLVLPAFGVAGTAWMIILMQGSKR